MRTGEGFVEEPELFLYLTRAPRDQRGLVGQLLQPEQTAIGTSEASHALHLPLSDRCERRTPAYSIDPGAEVGRTETVPNDVDCGP